MELSSRRARRPDSLPGLLGSLLDAHQVPLPTTAVRVLLTAAGRPTTAEQLSRVAAYERDDFLRTRMPPRLCHSISPDGRALVPRWWARGDWRLQRRILTEDVRTTWLAVLAERTCLRIAQGDLPADEAVRTLALGSIARVLGEDRYFDVPSSREEWMALRAVVLRRHPAASHSLEGPTEMQHTAEQALMNRGTPAVELYFGRRGHGNPTTGANSRATA